MYLSRCSHGIATEDRIFKSNTPKHQSLWGWGLLLGRMEKQKWGVKTWIHRIAINEGEGFSKKQTVTARFCEAVTCIFDRKCENEKKNTHECNKCHKSSRVYFSRLIAMAHIEILTVENHTSFIFDILSQPISKRGQKNTERKNCQINKLLPEGNLKPVNLTNFPRNRFENLGKTLDLGRAEVAWLCHHGLSGQLKHKSRQPPQTVAQTNGP